MNKLLLNIPPIIWQIFRFGVVGLTAAAINYGVVVLLVQNANISPLIANLFGFVAGFQMSYWGHRLWTFKAVDSLHRTAIKRLMIVQLLNFGANETLFFIFLSLNIPYQLALLIVLSVLPIFTFMASKWWVFSVRSE